MGGKVGENPAALRAAVFLLSSKNLRGGGGAFKRPPPSRARVNTKQIHEPTSSPAAVIFLFTEACRTPRFLFLNFEAMTFLSQS